MFGSGMLGKNRIKLLLVNKIQHLQGFCIMARTWNNNRKTWAIFGCIWTPWRCLWPQDLHLVGKSS